MDDAPHGAFKRAAPDRQLQGHQLGIRPPALVLDAIRTMPADRLAVAPPAAGTYRDNDLCSLAPPQQGALLGAPTGARLRTPVFASCRPLPKVLHGMLKVSPCVYLLRCQP
jgi:hypothetical protein